ncbi:MAG: hypothetical protein A3K19_00715 [Lentisphaerae bacterium RIFOXYB12_FULL_65_16]|nr:MAG: hypothetical protein A3K18_14795 [Lentisphaerae bacterium RIFOXYA12_64_32]OGV86810.1 MAG: hypothetical protein A3K19_00715 [Lentisphaerae bacterium RIFOXYB12_FULL_65_16]
MVKVLILTRLSFSLACLYRAVLPPGVAGRRGWRSFVSVCGVKSSPCRPVFQREERVRQGCFKIRRRVSKGHASAHTK